MKKLIEKLDDWNYLISAILFQIAVLFMIISIIFCLGILPIMYFFDML